MSTNKLMALIGNILFTLNNLVALFFGGLSVLVLANFQNLNTSTVTRDGSQVTVIHGEIFVRHLDGQMTSFSLGQFAPLFIGLIIFILLALIVSNVFTWIAFNKIEGVHSRGWRIFLLVIGILHIGSLFAGIFFILAFALRSGQNNVTKNASVS